MQANFEAIKSFFGKQAADAGQFNTLAGDFILSKLESFPGSISEGERDFLKGMVFGLQQSQEVNVVLLEDIIRKLRIPLDRAIWLDNNRDTTEAEYNSRVLKDVKRRAIPAVPVDAAP